MKSKTLFRRAQDQCAAVLIFAAQVMSLSAVIVVGLGMPCAAIAQVQTPLSDPVDANARTALARAQYQRVLDLYGPWIDGSDLPALARYRIAIAASNLGNYKVAARNLESAKTIDPLGRYASSVERIDALTQSIATGCSKTQDCDINTIGEDIPIDGVENATTGPPLPLPTSLAAESEVAAEDTLIATAPNAASSNPDKNVSEPPNVQTTSTDNQFKPELKQSSLGIGLLIAVCLLGIALASYKRKHKMPSGSGPSDSFALELRELRDRMGIVLAKAQDAYPKSELVQQLRLALPIVERECGRCEYDRSADAAQLTAEDRTLLERVSGLKSKPLNVLDCDRLEVAQMFQRQSWQ